MTVSFVLTYDSLTSTVLQYLERSDAATIAQIPTFITMCEFEIAQQIKTLGQLQVAEATMLTGTPVLQKPARWRKTVSFNVLVNDQRKPVLLRKYEYIKTTGQTTPRPMCRCITATTTMITGSLAQHPTTTIGSRCCFTSALRRCPP